MRTFVRVVLSIVFLAAIGLIVFLLAGPQEKETWATITGLLAVIAAVISSFPALRVLELQDDSSRPRPMPYFDLSSRYGLLQLRVKNIGPSVAYDVRLKWITRPFNYKGEEITVLDAISVLLPGQSVSVNLGSSIELVKKYSAMSFEGEVEFKDANRKSRHEKFVCSTQEHQRRLLHDEELPRTLYDLQKIPDELRHISTAIEKIQEGPRDGSRKNS